MAPLLLECVLHTLPSPLLPYLPLLGVVLACSQALLLRVQIIASRADCKGFAPDADLYIFRVFTSAQGDMTHTERPMLCCKPCPLL